MTKDRWDPLTSCSKCGKDCTHKSGQCIRCREIRCAKCRKPFSPGQAGARFCVYCRGDRKANPSREPGFSERTSLG